MMRWLSIGLVALMLLALASAWAHAAESAEGDERYQVAEQHLFDQAEKLVEECPEIEKRLRAAHGVHWILTIEECGEHVGQLRPASYYRTCYGIKRSVRLLQLAKKREGRAYSVDVGEAMSLTGTFCLSHGVDELLLGVPLGRSGN